MNSATLADAALAAMLTQPALSNALRCAGESLGVAIVTRGRSFAGFTTEGNACWRSARRMLRRARAAAAGAAKQRRIRPAGGCTIGAVPMCMPIAARLVGMLHDLHPGIVCTLRSMSSSELGRA